MGTQLDDYINKIILDDCIEAMKEMPESSIDAIVTDPPYGLEFMNRDWDKLNKHISPLPEGKYPKNRNLRGMRQDESDGYSMQLWHAQWLKEAYRVLKPGGSMLAMGGTRTFHRLMVAIEDTGFIIKDTLMWLYGSGFPKAQDLGKMIDKRMGKERKIIGKSNRHSGETKSTAPIGDYARFKDSGDYITEPATDLAKYWDGFKIGGIKPAYEPIVWAIKPPEGSYIDNVLKWGVGAVNVDECRIRYKNKKDFKEGHHNKKLSENTKIKKTCFGTTFGYGLLNSDIRKGRFPANIILDEEAGRLLNEQSGERMHSAGKIRKAGTSKQNNPNSLFLGDKGSPNNGMRFGDSGGASRFFYCAKASKSERGKNNKHPTVKPIKLFEWLIRLVTREGQAVLDPFLGSGTTAIAAYRSNRKYIGIEKEKEYIEIAKSRLAYWKKQPKQMKLI